ncbi:MAG: hypothetical protein HYZ26_13790 [Chloroflexi bacterium]|nr:hypothetical protein [Chloroflexota bacterium]
MNKRRLPKGCLWVGITALALLLVIGIAAIGRQALEYTDLDARLPPGAEPIQVGISEPGLGATAPAGVALLVDAYAFSPSPVLAIELWANDTLVGVHGAPPGGLTEMWAEFAWIPEQPGVYVLLARAHTAEDLSADSSGLPITIEPGQKTGAGQAGDAAAPLLVSQGASDLPAAQGPAIQPPAPPQPPGEDDSLGAADPWEGSPGEWFGQLTVGAPPAAPELTAEAEGCNAKLAIHDLSGDEEGFFIYRQSPASPAWERIATLDGQSQFEYITYTDPSSWGLQTYYAAAFNSEGEAAGNLASLSFDPECLPEAGDLAPDFSALYLSLAELDAGQATDGLYCYKSLDGAHWTRTPAMGFLQPSPAGNGPAAYEIASLVVTEGQPTPIALECWGWAGGDLNLLGTFKQDNLSDLLAFDNSSTLAQSVLALAPVALEGKSLPKVTSLTLLAPTVHLSYDTADCVSELQKTNAGNIITLIKLCHPGHPLTDITTHPHAYLIWDLDNKQNCEGAVHDLGCTDPTADPTVATWGFRLYDLHQSEEIPVEVYGSSQRVFIVPGPCDLYRAYEVKTFVIYQGGGLIFESTSPDSVAGGPLYPCTEGGKVNMQVEFHWIEFGTTDDDDIDLWGNDDKLELYGRFTVRANIPVNCFFNCPPGAYDGLRSRLMMAEWGNPQGHDGYCHESYCPQALYTGQTPLDAVYLCTVNSQDNCIQPWELNHNQLQILVGDGERLSVFVKLVDYDEASDDDIACQGVALIGPMSLAEWGVAGGYGYITQGENDSAESCTVYFTYGPAPGN